MYNLYFGNVLSLRSYNMIVNTIIGKKAYQTNLAYVVPIVYYINKLHYK